MDATQRTTLIRALLDRARSPDGRAAAARQLASEDDALDALLQVAQADEEDDPVAYAAGAAVAEILWRKQQVYEAPLAFFNGPAYLGFDATVASHQSGQPRHP